MLAYTSILVIFLTDFSAKMNPELLSQWLRQEYGSDYMEDVEKLTSKYVIEFSLL